MFPLNELTLSCEMDADNQSLPTHPYKYLNAIHTYISHLATVLNWVC